MSGSGPLDGGRPMRGTPIDDALLIERLGDLGGWIAWPTTPDLADRVVAALGTAPVPARRSAAVERLRDLLGGGLPGGRRIARRSLLVALVAVLALAVAAAAIGLGVPGIRIEIVPGTSAPSTASSISAPPAGPTGSPTVPSSAAPTTAVATPGSGATPPGDELGPVVSLDQARSAAGYGVLLPTRAGFPAPTEIHLAGVQPFTRLTILYSDHTTLTEFLGELQPDTFGKIVGPGTTVEPVRVGGADGWWIEGAPHDVVLQYRDADGVIRWREVTVTGHVLLWQVGAVTVRFETPLDRAAAIEIGASLR